MTNNSFMNQNKIKRGLFYTSIITLILLYVLPYAKIFYPDESIETLDPWINYYLWEDEELIIGYSIYTLIWILYFLLKQNKFIIITLGLYSIGCFFYNLL